MNNIGYELAESNKEALIELKNVEDEYNKLDKDDKEEKETKKILLFKPKSVSIFKIIWHLSGKLEIFLMIIAAISTMFSGSTNSLWGIIIGDTINELAKIVEYENLPKEEFQKELDKIEEPVNKLIYYFVFLGALTFITNFFMLFSWGYTALKQMHRLKKKYFGLILEQEQSWFDENNAFEFSTKIQNQLEQIEFGLGDRFGQIILLVSEIVSGFSVGFAISWKLTLIICSSFPIIIISVIISDYFAEKLELKSKELSATVGGIGEELIYNIRTVTSFCNFDYELNRYDNLIDEINKYDKKKLLIESISYGLLYVASFISISACLLYARILIIDGETNSGDVLKVMMCVLNVIYSVSGLGPNIQVVQKTCLASSDYFILLSKYKKKPKDNTGYIPKREDFQGKIEFKNVKFIYPSDKNQRIVLNDLNLLIEPGQKIALVGESGCGKSTTISLIERFYDIKFGQILIDGVDIKKYDLNTLRDLIGYVQQEPVLFNTTIRENLIFGRERKLEKFGDINKMMEEACEDAYIKKFIDSNVDGYNYVVGIKGNKLSGGQKQRIAIARAILMKPKILILDEATSSLDNKSEKEVQKALDNISKKNITTIVIAHRLSTIKNADLICAMKDGKIVEQGTHNELLEMNGYYAGLIRTQLAESEINTIQEKYQRDIDMMNVSITMSFDKFEEMNDINGIESLLLSESVVINNDDGKKKIKIDKKKLWELISDHKLDAVIGTIAGIIYGGISPAIGIFLGNVITALSYPEPEKVKSEGYKYGMIFIGVAFVGGISIFLKMWKLQCLGTIISVKIKKKIIKKYLELHMGYFDVDKHSPGALLTQLSIDSSQLDTLILNLIGGTITVISTLLISLILGIMYDWKTTLILFVFVPFIIYGIIKHDDYKENGRESNKEMKIEAGSILSECVINMKTIMSFNFQNKAIEIYENILSTEKKHYFKDSLKLGFWMGLGLSAYNFAFGAIYKCGFLFLREKSVTFENLTCCITNISNSCDGLSDILRNMGDSKKAKLAFKSVFRTLYTKSFIPPFESDNKNKISAKDIKGKIEFKNVYFAYPTKPDQIVLKNLNFVIEPGQKVGLVGLSGSGKSTILHLIERFYDVYEGEILIDDIDIKKYNLYELRKKISLVGQEPVIFKRSVYENILYGRLDATREEVLNIAEKSDIKYLIDNNNPLSGGEKQRVAIARAFLKDPKIILLDEATSSLDKETEKEVQKNIDKLQSGRTCLTVAHRLGTIIDSDIIFLFVNGELVERGTHQELIKLKKRYYTLHKYSRK